jgi:hypothetical protein
MFRDGGETRILMVSDTSNRPSRIIVRVREKETGTINMCLHLFSDIHTSRAIHTVLLARSYMSENDLLRVAL